MVVDTDPVVRAAFEGTLRVATRFSPETKGIDLFRSSGSSRSDRRNRPEEGLGLFEPMQPRLDPGPPILPPGAKDTMDGWRIEKTHDPRVHAGSGDVSSQATSNRTTTEDTRTHGVVAALTRQKPIDSDWKEGRKEGRKEEERDEDSVEKMEASPQWFDETVRRNQGVCIVFYRGNWCQFCKA